MMTAKLEQGHAAEDLACRYLQSRGLRLLERNFRCRLGELDLIMRDGDHLVFVEVRSRRNRAYGTPAETVTRTKQRRLARAAAFYLLARGIQLPCRFDVVAIVPGESQPEWIKDAFQVDA